jgi:transcriptional regulator with XRE-family HTH domain
MTVRGLAEAVRISPSLLEKIERGDRNPDPSLIVALSKALRVGPDRLYGQPYLNGTEREEGAQAVIPDLRRVLWTYDAPENLHAAPRPLSVLAAEMERVSQMRRDCRYTPMGAMLPGLLTELTHVALSSSGTQQAKAFWWLALGYRAANSLCHKLGYHDLSMTAIERVKWAAARSDDPFMGVVGDYLLLGALLRQGAWEATDKLTALLKDELRGITDNVWNDTGRGLMGSIILKEATALARRGDLDGCMTLLDEAGELADASRNVDGLYYETSFGPGNIMIHKVHALNNVKDGAGEAVRIADGFEPSETLPGERSSHHYIDLASAQLATNDRTGSLDSLWKARDIAPNHTRFHPTTRSTAAVLARLDRSTTERVTEYARWCGAI